MQNKSKYFKITYVWMCAKEKSTRSMLFLNTFSFEITFPLTNFPTTMFLTTTGVVVA